ncbi:uncharacterized protein F5147DRAFT_775849 [Suillus discolor]|uniref:Uncharacterized protein n=1 Tax=Suillus discolor TaxID=1912936 RepID=A0A9P7JS06_9AGAM|nr:uncharacterized protein F5147DRAFT_775849 [Suillus discolor]KAG2103725.1 hypothetical protein F5147DRAFT_775849 [Suillus discolor]
MPSAEDSNKALNDATTGILQILAKAVEWKGPANGHLSMAMEMGHITSEAFEKHGWLASVISPVFLLAVMELMEHWDLATKYITGSLSSPATQSPDQLTTSIPAHVPACPTSGLKSKPRPKPVPKQKQVIDHSVDSNEVEIIEVVTPTNTTRKSKQTSGGPEVVKKGVVTVPVLAETNMAETLMPGYTAPTHKQLEIVTESESKVTADRKGKGKEVVPPMDTSRHGHGRALQTHSSSTKMLVKRPASRQPAQDAGGEWFEQSLKVITGHKARKRYKVGNDQDEIPPDIGGDICMGLQDISTQAAGPVLDLQCIACQERCRQGYDTSTIVKACARCSRKTMRCSHSEPSVNVRLPSEPAPTLCQDEVRHDIARHASPTRNRSIAEEMEIDASGDVVLKDLQAMSLEVKKDSVSLPKAKDVHDAIKNLCTEVAELCTHNAASVEMVKAMQVHLAAQDAEIRTMETLHAKIAILQEEVKTLQAESQSRDAQLRSAEARVTSQGTSMTVLMDAYESLRKRIIPDLSGPPHLNHGMFFPPAGNVPSAGNVPPAGLEISAGQTWAMERLYFNLTLGPFTAGPFVLHFAQCSDRASKFTPGCSNAAGPSVLGSQTRRSFGESASRMDRN